MKKILLSAIACITIATFTACTSDSAVNTTEDNARELANRSNEWEGVIGEERNGEYYITADAQVLKADLEGILAEQGYETTLETLSIVERRLINAPTQVAYVLIGTDNANRSVGVSLQKLNYKLSLEDLSFTVATSCTGCAQGCNLQYLLIDGKKVPYCNENGCTYDCTKSESGLF